MKTRRGQFPKLDDDWIHTEVLGQKRKKGGILSNLVIIIVLICAVVLLVIAFQGMLKKNNLSGLENIDKINKDTTTDDAAKLEEQKKAEEAAKELEYVVKSGDTLAGIGDQFAVDWKKIAEKNNLAEPFALEVGQKLIIPGVKAPAVDDSATKSTDDKTGTPAATGDTTNYTVKAGDFLSTIGMQFDVPWEDIATLNNIASPYSLEVGQILKIPVKKAQ